MSLNNVANKVNKNCGKIKNLYKKLKNLYVENNLLIVSSKGGTPFSTIQEAVDFVNKRNPSPTNSFIINVLPGEYNENIVVPSFTEIKGQSKPVIRPQNNTLPVFTLSNNSSVSGFNVIYQASVTSPDVPIPPSTRSLQRNVAPVENVLDIILVTGEVEISVTDMQITYIGDGSQNVEVRGISVCNDLSRINEMGEGLVLYGVDVMNNNVNFQNSRGTTISFNWESENPAPTPPPVISEGVFPSSIRNRLCNNITYATPISNGETFSEGNRANLMEVARVSNYGYINDFIDVSQNEIDRILAYSDSNPLLTIEGNYGYMYNSNEICTFDIIDSALTLQANIINFSFALIFELVRLRDGDRITLSDNRVANTLERFYNELDIPTLNTCVLRAFGDYNSVRGLHNYYEIIAEEERILYDWSEAENSENNTGYFEADQYLPGKRDDPNPDYFINNLNTNSPSTADTEQAISIPGLRVSSLPEARAIGQPTFGTNVIFANDQQQFSGVTTTNIGANSPDNENNPVTPE